MVSIRTHKPESIKKNVRNPSRKQMTVLKMNTDRQLCVHVDRKQQHQKATDERPQNNMHSFRQQDERKGCVFSAYKERMGAYCCLLGYVPPRD